LKSRRIKVDYLARVEGEGGLFVKIRGDVVVDARLDIFEPPRFFEALLRGRDYTEPPDITARICGICPIAYQMSAAHAIESICGVTLPNPLRELRRLIYCGEWIESHVLHIYMLHAPDFLGYDDAVQMARDHPDLVTKALELKKVGNELVALLGGREIHPINVRIGGFYRVPRKPELARIRDRLEWARDAAIDTVRWTATLPFPQLEQDYEFVSLRHPDEYPFNEGRIVSNKGLALEYTEFLEIFEEEHVAHSTALQARIKSRGSYLVGPLARYALNFDKLPASLRTLAKEVGLGERLRNPFKSIIVRSLETAYACIEALRIIEDYETPDRPTVPVEPRAGTGHWATEAPRGLLYHQYSIDDDGAITDARIIPPTSQNQKAIEEDLLDFVRLNLELPDDKLTWRCEQIIRNYDPCISCSCHFLKLEIDREVGHR
jgi:coenzyme F420-reducing hydrogenase alpha subunit